MSTPVKHKPTKTELFVRLFLQSRNLTSAAIGAGYSKKYAHTMASRKMREPETQRLIAEISSKQDGNFEVTRGRVLGELAKLGYSNMQDFITIDDSGSATVDLSRLTRAQAAAIQEISVENLEGGKTRTKLKLANKKEALELLGRHLKLFDNDAQNNIGIKVVMVDIPRPKRPPELPETT